MPKLIVQYSSSTAFASGVIRRLCHSPYSHVDILLPGEGLLGVSGEDKSLKDPGGVRIRPFEPWPYLRKVTVELETDKVDKIIEAGKSQLGKPFDHSALWDFLSDSPPNQDRDWRNLEQWFCSEWFTWSSETGGLFPWKLAVAKGRVSPADSILLINPFLKPEHITALLTVK